MRENRTSGSEGGEAQTNELSLPLSLCHPVHSQCRRTLRGPIRSPRGNGSYTSPPGDIPSVGGPSVVRSDRGMEPAPTLCRSGLAWCLNLPGLQFVKIPHWFRYGKLRKRVSVQVVEETGPGRHGKGVFSRRPPVHATVKGVIRPISAPTSCPASHRSTARCALSQNSGELPKNRESRSAISGLTPRRSRRSSLIVCRETPNAPARLETVSSYSGRKSSRSISPG